MVHFMHIAPMHSYVTKAFVYDLYITIFSRVYSYVTRMYSCGVLVTILMNPPREWKIEWFRQRKGQESMSRSLPMHCILELSQPLRVSFYF